MRTMEHCSCIEEIHTDDEKGCVDEDDLFTVYVGIEQVDLLCAKIHDLLQRRKISKDRMRPCTIRFLNMIMRSSSFSTPTLILVANTLHVSLEDQ